LAKAVADHAPEANVLIISNPVRILKVTFGEGQLN
jgi:malate/lactate dehydrogenase